MGNSEDSGEGTGTGELKTGAKDESRQVSVAGEAGSCPWSMLAGLCSWSSGKTDQEKLCIRAHGSWGSGVESR